MITKEEDGLNSDSSGENMVIMQEDLNQAQAVKEGSRKKVVKASNDTGKKSCDNKKQNALLNYFQ